MNNLIKNLYFNLNYINYFILLNFVLFWNILSLNIEQLCEFILDDKKIGEFDIDRPISLDPISILVKLSQIKGENVSFEDRVKNASEYLLKYFGQKGDKDKGYEIKVNKKNQIPQLGLYCCALYLQMQRLEDRLNIIMPKSARGGISGISKNGFTPKDIMNAYTTEGKKQSYGSPYIYVDKEDKLNKWLIKANGTLEIILDIDRKTADKLKQMIDNAGVSSFYLGKKGLAYVSDIRLK
ncbi:type I-Fv CRISPR-associated protein Cas5fv [Neisseria dentiae]|uniref:type I-Fv CRISPR-associated protein Cas5fv n=1 Tax=Neisseria dentiae TaxID=194197 RepID=UPI0035A0F7DD